MLIQIPPPKQLPSSKACANSTFANNVSLLHFLKVSVILSAYPQVRRGTNPVPSSLSSFCCRFRRTRTRGSSSPEATEAGSSFSASKCTRALLWGVAAGAANVDAHGRPRPPPASTQGSRRKGPGWPGCHASASPAARFVVSSRPGIFMRQPTATLEKGGDEEGQ